MIFDKTNPFTAKIIDRKVLSKPGSGKCTVHLTLDISGSGIQYKVGDSVGVFPQNSHYIVEETLHALGFTGKEVIQDPRSDQEYPLEEFLREKANISKVTKKWIYFILEYIQDDQERRKLESLIDPANKEDFKAYAATHQLWDCLKEFKSIQTTPQRFADLITPLLPRFYSIASSQKKKQNEIDLLIAYFHYSTNEHIRYGVASYYLCESSQMHTPCIPLYLHPSKGFTVPPDTNKPMIMVGPGTGVAPFRGFMQERVATKASGKNWLFFGDWNEEFDFLYEEEWRALENEGQLQLSIAFSRDQKEKIYVQNLMRNSSKEIWQWLEEGAYFYVCGDAQHMAKDVDQMLHKIIESEGLLSVEEAKGYVKSLKGSNRYIRDVY